MHISSKLAREQTTRLINQLYNETRSGSINRNGQMSQTIAQFRKHIAGNNSISDFNTADQTNRDLSASSILDRDKLVNLLKNETNGLQTQNKILRKQIQRLNANLSLQQSSDTYLIPYIRINEELQMFATRIFIDRQNYQRIDYDQMMLCLIDFELKVYRSNIMQQGNRKTTLNLKDIKSVQYINFEANQHVMIIQFNPLAGDAQYLFIKFNNQQQRKKWDFALYFNKIIEAALVKDRLFQQSTLQQLSIITKKQGLSTSNLYQRRKVSYNDNLREGRQNPESKLSKSSSAKNGISFNDKDSMKQYTSRDPSQKGFNISKKSEKQKNKNDQSYREQYQKQIAAKKKMYLQNKNPELQSVNWGLDIQDQQPSISINKNQAFYINNSHTSFGRTQSSPFRIDPISILKSQSHDNNLDVSVLTNTVQRRNKIIKSLQQQKCFVKCSKGGIKSHTKIVYLSDTQSELCWRDMQNGRIRKISIQDIKQITAGQKGPGLAKHANKIDNQNCVVIKTKDDKMIQLYDNKQAISKFAKELRMLVFNDGDIQFNDQY